MSTLSLSTTFVDQYLSDKTIPAPTISLKEAHKSLQERTCIGNDFLGWIDLPSEMRWEKIEEIQAVANELREKSDVLIICGIGGSYLGARAVIEAWEKIPPAPLSQGDKKVVFLGNHLSGREYDRVFSEIGDKEVSACIISKSGTTLETAISYRLVRNFLLSKYDSEEVQKRIVTITDEKNGALRIETTQQWYTSFILPWDIGGRYSVLTAVGLLPCAFAGIDIQKLIEGAATAQKEIKNTDLRHSVLDTESSPRIPAFSYAQKRVDLELSGFVSEIFVTMEPSLYYLWEWWKQLMGESHGKERVWLYPDTLTYTTDLHSLGQYVQEGRRLFFETFLWIQDPISDEKIPAMTNMQDGLDPLVGRTLHEMNHIALESTAKAHADGGCPSMTMTLEALTPENLGYWMYSMMYACALSGLMIGVNPFDQPGVEAYKSEMRKRF